jgi:hypothetical protein
MEINKIEYIGEVCSCDENSHNLSACHTGFSGGMICSNHPEVERISLITWVGKKYFDHPFRESLKLKPGKYKITIEKIE